jgi:hypothetical protein
MFLECYEYLWNFDETTGRLTCKRHGLDWRDETGDGAILALLDTACETREQLQADNARLRDALERVVAWGNERNFDTTCESGKMLINARAALGKE